jgi:hypothetical protein
MVPRVRWIHEWRAKSAGPQAVAELCLGDHRGGSYPVPLHEADGASWSVVGSWTPSESQEMSA